MNFEKKVKNIHPEAEPWMGIMGWGIRIPKTILAIARFRSSSLAWQHAWHVVSAEENRKANNA